MCVLSTCTCTCICIVHELVYTCTCTHIYLNLLQVCLTWPAVGNLTIGWKPEGPGRDVEEHINRLTTLVAAFFSAVVGGEVNGRDVIWPTVSLDGENAGKRDLQPDSTCSFRFLRATTSEQDAQVRSSAPNTFMTTFDAAGYEDSVILWNCLQEGHVNVSRSLL